MTKDAYSVLCKRRSWYICVFFYCGRNVMLRILDVIGGIWYLVLIIRDMPPIRRNLSLNLEFVLRRSKTHGKHQSIWSGKTLRMCTGFIQAPAFKQATPSVVPVWVCFIIYRYSLRH